MRYVSSQLCAYLTDDLWLDLAKHANQQAQAFFEGCKDQVEFIHPVDANEVFCRLPVEKIAQLKQQGFEFHVWPGSNDIIRLVFSHASSTSSVKQLIAAVK